MCAASGMESFRLIKVWYFTYIGTVAFGRSSLLDPPDLHAASHSVQALSTIPKCQGGGAEPNPSDQQPSGPPVPRFKALGSAQPRHRHQLGSTASTAFPCSLLWEADGSAALWSFSLLFQITLWKTQTSPRTFRDVIYQEGNFFPFYPKWAWMGFKKPLMNP